MKKIVVAALFVLLFPMIFSSGGDGADIIPARPVNLSMTAKKVAVYYFNNSAPGTTRFGNVGVTVDLPAGASVDVDGTGAIAADVLQSQPAGATVNASYSPEFGATPGRLVLNVASSSGFGPGTFLTAKIRLPLATNVTSADFPVYGYSARDTAGSDLGSASSFVPAFGYPESTVSKPGLRIRTSEATSGTTLIRLTDSVADGGTKYVPEYSKVDPYNADESVFMLYGPGSYFYIFNAATRLPIKRLLSIGGIDGEPRWHKTNPNAFYYHTKTSPCQWRQYDITTDAITTLYAFPEYVGLSGTAEGNLSNDGRYMALRGTLPNGQYEFFLLDIQTGAKVGTRIDVGVDWVTVSPSGNFILMNYGTPGTASDRGVWLHDRNFNRIRQVCTETDHADVGYDKDGTEVYVTTGLSANKPYITKYRINPDGTVASLKVLETRMSDGVTSNWQSLHISMRATGRPGWALVSYMATGDPGGNPPRPTYKSYWPDTKYDLYENDVIWLKLDGSQQVERLAQSRSHVTSPTRLTGDYWAEPHATVNRSGTKVIFSSNWGELPDSGNSIVESYLIER
ncbi:MAG: hypothetical protein HY896_05495 [Deltaproteobacteria bacterium]|nr:hypothetical protein [Deltaproteobacteria bacterium]